MERDYPVNILIVDDLPENLLAIEAVLENEPYRLIKARSGEEALRCLLKDEIAVILLDVQMPGMDGFETARHMKAFEKSKQIPILFVTATSNDARHFGDAYSAGAIDYIVKPFEPYILKAKIQGFVSLYDAKKRQERMNRELERLNAQLEKAKEIAEQASRTKTNFISFLSHEIRTPMNGIMGVLDLLLDSRLTEDQRELAKLAAKSGDTLMRILNDVLSYSKLESTGIEVDEEPFWLEGCLEQTRDIFTARIREKNLDYAIEIDPELPEYVHGDPALLRQILLNLVGNAVKFTSEGGIAVRADKVGETGDSVSAKFTVKDTGIGIPEEKTEEVFLPFAQADPFTNRQFGGSGLGLAICKALVERMGGDIRLEKTAEPGTTLTFTLAFKRGERPSLALPNAGSL